jgi:hypothetical protein
LPRRRSARWDSNNGATWQSGDDARAILEVAANASLPPTGEFVNFSWTKGTQLYKISHLKYRARRNYEAGNNPKWLYRSHGRHDR